MRRDPGGSESRWTSVWTFVRETEEAVVGENGIDGSTGGSQQGCWQLVPVVLLRNSGIFSLVVSLVMRCPKYDGYLL